MINLIIILIIRLIIRYLLLSLYLYFFLSTPLVPRLDYITLIFINALYNYDLDALYSNLAIVGAFFIYTRSLILPT